MTTQTQTAVMSFETGPYGEIVPPPLVGGLNPDEALGRLVQDSHKSGSPIVSVPKRGQSRRGMINLAMLYVHQSNLVEAIAGRLDDDPDAAALRRAVVEQRRPLSLRPLGMEGLWFTTFAPVLQLVDPQDGLWRVGMPERGRVTTFRATLDNAIRQAQQVYVAWCADEDQRWQDWLNQAVREAKPHYQYLVWQAALTTAKDLTAHLADGYALKRLGKHSTYLISAPEGERIFETSRPRRAVLMAGAVLARQKVSLPNYLPGQVVRSLVKMGSRYPEPTGRGAWQVGEIKAGLLKNRMIGLVLANKRFGLKNQRNVLSVAEISKTGRAGRSLGSLIVPGVWAKEEKMRVGLSWAAWVIGGVR